MNEIERLRKENEAMRRALLDIIRNAPDDKEQPQDTWKWTMWVAGNIARDTLQALDSTPAEADRLNADIRCACCGERTSNPQYRMEKVYCGECLIEMDEYPDD